MKETLRYDQTIDAQNSASSHASQSEVGGKKRVGIIFVKRGR